MLFAMSLIIFVLTLLRLLRDLFDVYELGRKQSWLYVIDKVEYVFVAYDLLILIFIINLWMI